jgi:enamine deaminase RidA (YjgF/YER057c/UK114 family)
MEYQGPLTKLGLKCINSPGLGEKLGALFGISSVVVIPPNATLFETCGHTGCSIDIEYPTSLKEEILQAFQNVENALLAAGVPGGWQAVYKMTTYHVGSLDAAGEGLEAAMAKYLGNNRPAWCGVVVAGLTGPARLEITVSAAKGSS